MASSESEKYSISVYRGKKGKEGKWEPIADVLLNEENEDKNGNKNVTYIRQEERLGEFKLLALHERSIINAIKEYEKTRINETLLDFIDTKGEEKEIISSYKLHICNFRRGTVFIMAQFSSVGIRFISYATNKIHHDGICFGTSPPDHLKYYELEEQIESAIKKVNERGAIPARVCKLIENGWGEFHC